ncbi:hypothetical protein LEN26_021056 [Aphanomyces euteiches]|nr:hypothetical protein LEN26_021056 [Aphanomyces euteiches]
MRGNTAFTVIGPRHAAAVTSMLMAHKNTDSALQHPHAQQLSTSPPTSTYNWPDNSPRTGCPIKTSTSPSNASLWLVAASQTHFPCRAAWQHDTTRTTATPHQGPLTMIAIAPNRWVLALHIQRIIGSLQPEDIAPVIAQLQWEIPIPTRKPYGYIIPRWIYQMALISFPTLAPPDILLSQWMGGPNGARFAGPLAQRTTLVPSPPLQHSDWWLDATYQPYPPTWWSQLGQELYRARSSATPYTYILVVFDQSPGRRFGLRHHAKWHVTIPSGAMAMRHETTIVQDTLPKLKTLYRMNTHAIHIGIITPGEDLPAAEEWYIASSAPRATRTGSTLILAHRHHHYQPTGYLKSTTNTSDPCALRTREFPQEQFPTIYNAPLGIFSNCHCISLEFVDGSLGGHFG